MRKYKEKFIVINYKHLNLLNSKEKNMLNSILSKINNKNKYCVCNQDEPYAKDVWKIIKKIINDNKE